MTQIMWLNQRIPQLKVNHLTNAQEWVNPVIRVQLPGFSNSTTPLHLKEIHIHAFLNSEFKLIFSIDQLQGGKPSKEKKKKKKELNPQNTNSTNILEKFLTLHLKGDPIYENLETYSKQNLPPNMLRCCLLDKYVSPRKSNVFQPTGRYAK